jgi:short-subunit dehydrogenase
VTFVKVDLSNRENVSKAVNDMEYPTILILNAGTYKAKEFHTNTIQDFERTININFLSHAFITHFIMKQWIDSYKSDPNITDLHLVTVSSSLGLMSSPYLSTMMKNL